MSNLQSTISAVSWLVCQPNQPGLRESGSPPATGCSAANHQTAQTQEQGQIVLGLVLPDMACLEISSDHR